MDIIHDKTVSLFLAMYPDTNGKTCGNAAEACTTL